MQDFVAYGTNSEMDKLVDSEHAHKRLEAVVNKYGLEKLVNDPSWLIRCRVAVAGYGLDKLIKDKDTSGTTKSPRHYAKWYLNAHHYSSIEDWIQKNPSLCVLEKNTKSDKKKKP